MTQAELQFKLFEWREKHGHSYITPNCKPFGHDVDVFSVTKDGLGIDHEIKCSTADFRSEIRAANWDARDRAHRPKSLSKYWKHKALVRQYEHPKSIEKCVNYFYFVSPLGVVPFREVPEYAGLIWYLPEHNTFEIAKRAPKLHDRRVYDKTLFKVARSLSFQYWKNAARYRTKLPDGLPESD